MTVDKLKAYMADLAAAGVPREEVIAKAQAMVNGEVVVDADGNPVEIEVINLSTSAESEPAQEAAPEENSATVSETKQVVLGVIDEMRGRRAAPPPPQVEAPRAVVPAEAISVKSRAFSSAETAYKFGQWVAATVYGSARAREWCKTHSVPIVKAMGEGTNSLGGFLVPPQFEAELIALRERYGVFRRNARVRPMASDTLTIPRGVDELTAYFVAENAAITESDRTYDSVMLVARKLAILVRTSRELVEDAMVSVMDDLAQSVAFAFAKKEDDCGFNGDGTSTYGGISGLKTSIGSAGVNTQGSGTAWSAITLADFNNTMGKLPAYAAADESQIRWYMSNQFYHSVAKRLADAAGGATVMELEERGVVYRFLGFPVEITQVLPTSSSSATIVAYFGNLSLAASLGDRRATTLQVLEERYAEYDQIGLLATQRFDINVHDAGSSSVAGPIVALKTG